MENRRQQASALLWSSLKFFFFLYLEAVAFAILLTLSWFTLLHVEVRHIYLLHDILISHHLLSCIHTPLSRTLHLLAVVNNEFAVM